MTVAQTAWRRSWTLDIIHDRCVDDGDCWIWNQAVNSAGHPQACIDGKGGQLVRRKAFELFNGVAARRVMSTCSRLCCNPEHLVSAGFSEPLKAAYANGTRSRFLLASRRRKDSRMTETMVSEIRCARGTAKRISEEFGVPYSTVKDIRRGRTWRRIGASVFGWAP